jgi:hypothetical protein
MVQAGAFHVAAKPAVMMTAAKRTCRRLLAALAYVLLARKLLGWA